MGSGKGRGPQPKRPQQPLSVPSGAPPGRVIVFAEGFVAALGEHPAINGAVLDLHFKVPGSTVTVRIPVGSWAPIRAEVDKLITSMPAIAETQRAAAAGIHLPDGANIEAEAEGLRRMKEGPAT
jgi:hypothetical protein